MPHGLVSVATQTAPRTQRGWSSRDAQVKRRRFSRSEAWLVVAALLLSALSLNAAPTASANVVGGQVIGWGADYSGQTNTPSSLAHQTVVGIAGGSSHSLALTSDGEVTAWGDNHYGQVAVPSSLAGETVTAIAAGVAHNLALTGDGQVITWGWDHLGQSAVPSSADEKVIGIAAGAYHSLALTSDGQVIAWGDNSSGQAAVPPVLAGKTVTALAAGFYHSLALTSDGQVIGWGEDSDGEITVPPVLAGKTVVAIAAGGHISLALTSDGHVTGWGYHGYGQDTVPSSLAGKTVTAIAAGYLHCLALTSDGKVTAWGVDDEGQTSVPASLNGTRVTAIAAGHRHSLAILRSDTAPVVRFAPKSVTVQVGVAASFTATSTGTPDPTVQWQRANRGGSFADVGGAKGFVYTTDPATSADDGAQFRAVFTNSAGTITTDPATLTVNSPPTAIDQTLTTPYEAALDVTLAGNDPDGDVISFAVVDKPTHGQLVGASPNLTYIPDRGYVGSDSFTYNTNDGFSDSAPATVRIQVAGSPCVPSRPKREFTVSSDRSEARFIRSRDITTKRRGELLVAFVSANGPTNRAQSVTQVTGGGLTWSLVQRNNETTGTSEIWQAYAERKLSSARVTAILAETGSGATMTVAGFTNAGKVTGASGHTSRRTSNSTPRMTFIAENSQSKVWAVGRVIGSRYHPRAPRKQSMVYDRTYKSPAAGLWTQRVHTPTTAGQPVNITSTTTTNHTWSYTAVEITGECRR